MARTITLTVLDGRYCDPMALITTTTAGRAADSRRLGFEPWRWPLRWDPPPDTLLMRACDVDLGVFSEDVPGGELRMIDPAHPPVRRELERLVVARPAATVNALIAAARGRALPAGSASTITEALERGEWSVALDDALLGPLVQAAGFARRLHATVFDARSAGRCVTWEYTGLLRYDYPP